MKNGSRVLGRCLSQMCVAAAQPAAPAADRALAREILEELIEIPTTQSDGTARAAQAIAARLSPPVFQRKMCASSPRTATSRMSSRAFGAGLRAFAACC